MSKWPEASSRGADRSTVIHSCPVSPQHLLVECFHTRIGFLPRALLAGPVVSHRIVQS